MVNLRRLKHVVALGKLGSFALAAESVHLSQPAFSRSIQSIEEEYGVELFVRGTRVITPTPYGKFVIERAKKILQEVQGLQRDVDLMKAHEYGEVLVGVGPIPAGVLLIPVISKLNALHPTIRIRVEITHWQNLLRLLNAEALDFFIADTRELLNNRDLFIEPLPELPITCFCRPEHPLIKNKPEKLSIDEVMKYPLGAFRFPNALYNDFAKSIDFKGDRRMLWSIECDNMLVLEQIAASNNLVIFGPSSAFKTGIKEKKLVEIQLNKPLNLSTHFGIIYLKNRLISPAAEHFLEFARAELESELKKITQVSKKKK